MTQASSTKTFFGGIYSAPKYLLLAGQHIVAIPEGTGIYEDPTNKLIFFPAAGYTKPVSCHGGFSDIPSGEFLQHWNLINRQGVIKALISNHGVTEPTSKVHVLQYVSIELIPEPTNPYDEDAVLIMVKVNGKDMKYPIGYVPSKINTILADKRAWFNDEDLVLIMRPDEKGKHTIPQLVVKYEAPNTRNRFGNIEYE